MQICSKKKDLGIVSPEPDYKQALMDGFNAGMRTGRELLANEIADVIIARMENAPDPAGAAMTAIGEIIQKLQDELREEDAQ